MLNNIGYKFSITAVVVGGLVYFFFLASFSGGTDINVCPQLLGEQTPLALPDAWESSKYLVGPPTDHYLDNLRQDINYVTSWVNAGFTNQFINYVNLIYLGTISDRIPIVPPFSPDDHISRSAGPILFSSIFDLDALRHTLRTPIIEWVSVKNSSSLSLEAIGCWSTRSPHEAEPIKSESLLEHLQLDVSYTRVPAQLRRTTGHIEPHVLFFPTAELIFPGSPSHNGSEYPLMLEDYEWNYPWSPAWRVIGRHLKFTQGIVELAEGYLHRLFKILKTFQNSFQYTSDGGISVSSAVQVQEVRDELSKTRGWDVSRVVLSSDETSSEFWTSVSAQGWHFINHTTERTLERYGEWIRGDVWVYCELGEHKEGRGVEWRCDAERQAKQAVNRMGDFNTIKTHTTFVDLRSRSLSYQLHENHEHTRL
ncbi:hypothetical protein BD779DRAFT_1783800 [Infundibulicybe gibba]|nr:hypothetical protein BD779DRAFT_1783800 [Infundibulicybe gibba]